MLAYFLFIFTNFQYIFLISGGGTFRHSTPPDATAYVQQSARSCSHFGIVANMQDIMAELMKVEDDAGEKSKADEKAAEQKEVDLVIEEDLRKTPGI